VTEMRLVDAFEHEQSPKLRAAVLSEAPRLWRGSTESNGF